MEYKVYDRQPCAEGVLEELLRLTNRVYQADAAPFLYPPSEEAYKKWLHKHVCFSVWDAKNMVAFSVLQVAKFPSYLKDIIPVTPDAETAMLLFTLVDPEYRRQGISSKLMARRMSEAKRLGFRHLLSMVHPDNTASIATLKAAGLREVAVGEVFEEKLPRAVYYKSL